MNKSRRVQIARRQAHIRKDPYLRLSHETNKAKGVITRKNLYIEHLFLEECIGDADKPLSKNNAVIPRVPQ